MAQVNTSGEASKSGAEPGDDAVELCRYIDKECANLVLVGLMTIGRYGEDCSGKQRAGGGLSAGLVACIGSMSRRLSRASAAPQHARASLSRPLTPQTPDPIRSDPIRSDPTGRLLRVPGDQP